MYEQSYRIIRSDMRGLKGYLGYPPHTPMSKSILYHSDRWSSSLCWIQTIAGNFPSQKSFQSMAGLLSFFNKDFPYNWTKNLFPVTYSFLLVLPSGILAKQVCFLFCKMTIMFPVHLLFFRLTIPSLFNSSSYEEVSRILNILVTFPWKTSSVPLKTR